MKLLIDTDAFCKLTIGGVFDDAIRLLGAQRSECGRLSALPFMLSKGKLVSRYGRGTCATLRGIALNIPEMVQATIGCLEPFNQIEDIHVGEAQLFASATEFGCQVLTGDKRALRALQAATDLHAGLSGRIVAMEAILIALCDSLSPKEVFQRVQPLIVTDDMFRVCFSNPKQDPRTCLRSYFGALTTQVAPLVLWQPPPGGKK